MYKFLRIYFGTEANFFLDFELIKSPVTDLWIERMECRNQWNLDNPDRFYGLDPLPVQTEQALSDINRCINIIDSYRPVANKTLNCIHDQDTLNYLHNIFEKYHGQLDQQHHKFWINAPAQVKKALAQLNIAVHRCESVARGASARFVCTWWDMPKIKSLPIDLIKKYGLLGTDAGGVYLNYVEIGKTILDLAMDDDQYISDNMFKPFNFYSADFVVHFKATLPVEIAEQQQIIHNYYNKNKEFFVSRNILNTNDPSVQPLKFKVAQLIPQHNINTTIQQLSNSQYIYTQ
jgi:hypothetical protein